MTCEQAELRMAELLAGEIAAEDRAALEKHLLDCATCRGDFEFARAGARAEWADVSVPKEVIEATLASFREPAPVVRLLRWATAAAAAVGLVALLIASSRAPKAPEPVVAACQVERPQMLATMQDPAVGAMVCQDEDGRPVGELGLKSHEVSVEILDGIAKTTVEENFENHTGRRLEGTFNFPLPADASISRLALEVNGKIEEGTCLERERAREVFEGIVRRMQDPALLEWQPGGFFKCRVFPIEPRATKRVIVAYTQALPCFQGKMSYVYPLASEKTRTHAPEEVRISVQARFSGALAKIESPSHHLEVQRRNANEASMSFRAAHYRPNNDFVVTMEPGAEEVRVVAHKTDGEDGYFACFATPQGGGERAPAKVAFVLDVSASTNAPRLEVAKRLVRGMMERRIEGDRFEVLAHNIEVQRSGEVDLRAANTFMDRLQPVGGSDVLQALQAAGDAEVIYIGKGAPSFGEMETAKILDAVKGRRIRTIAVGADANVALLERLGGMMRVSPNDDVAKRVAEISATLGAPVLSDVKIEGGDAIYDVVGVRDLFYGERLIVSGRYRGPTAKLTLSGRGYRREVDVAFPAKEEGNNYVRRLWAQRKVADLLAKGPATKPEVTDLGVKYQIMTPYTSFLVLENEQMWKDHQLKREVQKQDEVLGKDLPHQREVKRKVAHLLELSYMAIDQKKFDRAIKLCEEILIIDPNYPVARELKDDVEKSRHKEEYWSVWAGKLEELKRQTNDDEEVMLPKATSMKVPTREEWAEVSKRLTSGVIKTEGGAADVWEEPVGKLKPKPDVVAPTDPKPREVAKPEPPTPPAAKPDPTPPSSRFELSTTERPRDPKPAPNMSKSPPPPAVKEPIPVLVEENKVIVKPVFDTLRGDRDDRKAIKERNIRPDATLEGFRWVDNGYLGNQLGGLEIPSIFTITTNVTAPGAPITDALPVDATGVDFFSPTFKGSQHIPQQFWIENGEAARVNDLQRALDSINTLSTKHEADLQVFVRQMEVQRAQLQELEIRVEESRTKLAKSLNEKSLAIDPNSPEFVEYRRKLQQQVDQDKAVLELKKIELAIASQDEPPKPTGQAGPMDVRVLHLRNVAPPAPFTAKVEPGKTIMGQPLLPPVDPQQLQRWNVYQLAQSQMTKDVNGRVLGTLNFDPQTNVFVVRDTPEAMERVAKVLAAADRPDGERLVLEEKMNLTHQRGNVNVAPKKALEGKVTAVAPDIGLIVFSIGKDDGVLEGDEFTVFRGGDFVAKIVVDRSDRKWAAGKIVLKKSDPKVADDISNHIFIGPREGWLDAACIVPSIALEVATAAEDGSVFLTVKNGTAVANRIYAVTRAGKFVALIRSERVVNGQAEAKVLPNLAVGRILPGDGAVYVADPKTFLSLLPLEVRLDLASRASQQAIRAKMGWKE